MSSRKRRAENIITIFVCVALRFFVFISVAFWNTVRFVVWTMDACNIIIIYTRTTRRNFRRIFLFLRPNYSAGHYVHLSNSRILFTCSRVFMKYDLTTCTHRYIVYFMVFFFFLFILSPFYMLRIWRERGVRMVVWISAGQM